jgi:hypothetical protein
MLHRTFVFVSDGIFESQSAFQCVRVANHRHSIFKLRWDRYRFDKKRLRPLYAKLVFSHPVGSMGNVVPSSASGVQNVDALFLCSGRTGEESIKIVL